MSEERVIYLLTRGEYSDYTVLLAFSSKREITKWWERLEWKVVMVPHKYEHIPYDRWFVYAADLGYMAQATSEDAANTYIAEAKKQGIRKVERGRYYIQERPFDPCGRITPDDLQ